MCPICAHWSRVCSLQLGLTPLMFAAQGSGPRGIVEVLLNGKADLEAADPVSHLEDNRRCPNVLIAHACVR